MRDGNDNRELDAFWNLKRITPPRISAFSDRCDPVEIVSDAPEADVGKAGNCRVSVRSSEYVPASSVPVSRTAQTVARYTGLSPYFCEVTVQTFPSGKSLCDRFLQDAEHYADMVPPASAEPQPFYSHLPQYTQLSRAALDWYLFWRAAFLGGEAPEIADSYLLLFVFETLNLTSIRFSPEEGLVRLLRLWTVYRGAHHMLDRCLSEWVCDFCLRYGLILPAELPESVRTAGIQNCSLREFYLVNSADCAFLAYLSDYDYRKSKFYPENAAMYDSHIPQVLRKVGCGWLSSDTVCSVRCLRTVQRSCYIGALIHSRGRCRLEIRYYAVTRSPEAHRGATALFKCAENGLRRVLGIRSQLHVEGLPGGSAEQIDAYFAPLIPKKTPTQEPEYMAQYEPESVTLDLSRVHRLERESWNVTSMLVPEEVTKYREMPISDINREEDAQTPKSSLFVRKPASEPAAEAPPVADGSPSDRLFLRAVSLLLSGNIAEFAELAGSAGMLTATLVEMLNEKCLTLIGDIAFEGDGVTEPYHVIPCYRQELEALIEHADTAEL